MVLKLVDSKKTGKKTLAFIEAAFNKYQLHCLNVVRKSSKEYYSKRGTTFSAQKTQAPDMSQFIDSVGRGDVAATSPAPVRSQSPPAGPNKVAAEAARNLLGQQRREEAMRQQALAASVPLPQPFYGGGMPPGYVSPMPVWNPMFPPPPPPGMFYGANPAASGGAPHLWLGSADGMTNGGKLFPSGPYLGSPFRPPSLKSSVCFSGVAAFSA